MEALAAMQSVVDQQTKKAEAEEVPKKADEDEDLWRRIRAELAIGQSVTATVICRRPFGVFLDIGYGTAAPGLLSALDLPLVTGRGLHA